MRKEDLTPVEPSRRLDATARRAMEKTLESWGLPKGRFARVGSRIESGFDRLVRGIERAPEAGLTKLENGIRRIGPPIDRVVRRPSIVAAVTVASLLPIGFLENMTYRAVQQIPNDPIFAIPALLSFAEAFAFAGFSALAVQSNLLHRDPQEPNKNPTSPTTLAV